MMNEHELAKAIAVGAAPSPSPLGDSHLLAMRASGTGFCSRNGGAERAYRSRDTWLSEDMQRRILGTPVTWEHPASGTLDAESYGNQTIGSIVHSYVAGRDGIADEGGTDLWCVARVFVAPEDLETLAKASTSPGVLFPASELQTIDIDGEKVLIEPPPLTGLDHLSAVAKGVWDKGSSDRGIRFERSDRAMADSSEGAVPPVPVDPTPPDVEHPGVEPDKLLSLLDAISKKCDAMAERHDSFSARLDAVEAEGKVRKKEGETAEVAADRRRADARQDAVARKREDEDRIELADIQARADGAYMTWGMRAAAPMQGESPLAYRVRMARPMQKHSKQWKDIPLHGLTPEVLDVAEKQIYADALAADLADEVPHGILRQVRKLDDSGRMVSTFVGKGTFISQLKPPHRKVVSFNTRPAA